MSPGPVILKFGGTSVADAEAIGRLVRHVGAAHRRARAVVVVSALSGITDRLFHLAAAAAAADEPAVAAGLDELQQRHDTVAHQAAPESAALRERIAADMAELRNLLHAIGTLKDAVAAHPRRGGRLRRAPEQPHRRSGLSGGGTAGRVDRSAPRADHQRHVRLCAAVDGRDHRRRGRASPAARRRRPRAGDRRLRRRHAVAA